MADIEYIVPGSGIVNDTETNSEIIIPGFGIYNEQAGGAPPALTILDYERAIGRGMNRGIF